MCLCEIVQTDLSFLKFFSSFLDCIVFFFFLLHCLQTATSISIRDNVRGGGGCYKEESGEFRQNLDACRALPTPFPNLSIKHKRIPIFCHRPNLNHFPSVAGSLPVYHTVTSQSNPQMRITKGLDIRYEKVLTPL